VLHLHPHEGVICCKFHSTPGFRGCWDNAARCNWPAQRRGQPQSGAPSGMHETATDAWIAGANWRVIPPAGTRLPNGTRPPAKNIHIHPPLDSLAATLPLTPPRASTDGAPPRLLAVLLEPTWIRYWTQQTFESPFQDPLTHSFLPCQRLTVPFGRIALQSSHVPSFARTDKPHTTTPRNDALPVPRGPLRARPPLAGIPASRRALSPICAALPS
jgi:hypothetical protein